MAYSILADEALTVGRRNGRAASFARLYHDLLARRRAAQQGNPRSRGLASGVTATVSTTQPSTTTYPIVPGSRSSVASFAPYFKAAGGWLTNSASFVFPLVATRSPGQTVTGGGSGVAYQTVSRIVFHSTAATIHLLVKQSMAAPVRILVDGQYVDLAGTTITSDGVVNYLTLSFAAGRAPAGRRIEVEIAAGLAATVGLTQFGGVQQAAAEAIWAPSSLGPRIGLFGDSITHGANAGQNGDGYARRMGDLMGVDDLWQSGISGSGYLTRGSSGTTSALIDRVSDIRDSGLDLAILRMGVNDVLNEGSTFNGVTVGAATIGAAVASIVAQVRAGAAALPIIVFGPFRKVSTTFDNKAPAYEAAIQAAVAAAADPLILFVPTIGASPPLQTGSGYAGATTGDGPGDWAMSSDATHPTPDGHAAVAERGVADLFVALRQMASNLGI